MADTHPALVNLLYRSAISSLPANKREIYQYVESKELELEELAVSEKHFVQLMYNHSPFKEAARYFSLDIATVKKIMDEAQAEIDSVIVRRINGLKWIDYSADGKQSSKHPRKKWTFVFLS